MSNLLEIICVQPKTVPIEQYPKSLVIEKYSGNAGLTWKEPWGMLYNNLGDMYEVTTEATYIIGTEYYSSSHEIIDFEDIAKSNVTWFNNMHFMQFGDYDECVVCVNEKYRKPLIQLLKMLIKRSRVRTIIFYCRMQGQVRDRYVGTLSLQDFCVQLDEHKILHNIAYLITDQKR
jgi:hypothetical protein